MSTRSFCLLYLNSFSIYRWDFRISYLIMHRFAVFSNYFMDAMFYTSFIAPQSLEMELIPSVPMGSGLECQKGDVVLQNMSLGGMYTFSGSVLFFYKTLLCTWGCSQLTKVIDLGKQDHLPIYGEGFPSFLMKQYLIRQLYSKLLKAFYEAYLEDICGYFIFIKHFFNLQTLINFFPSVTCYVACP